MIETEVVVAGAGPVGSIAAYWLAEQGIETVLLEAGADCAADLRASTFHPPTLEMLEDSGVTQMLHQRGLKAPVYQYRDRARGVSYKFDLGELEGETKYPYRIQCEQYHMSRQVSDLVAKHEKADTLFGHRLIYLEQDEDGVSIVAETPTGIERLRARYLIGADGANSLVRKLLEIDFDGFTYPEKFLCLTTPAPLEEKIEDLEAVNYISDPEQWHVILRVPSLWRVLVPADGGLNDQQLLSDEHRDEVFAKVVREANGSLDTRHRTIYRVHQRVAKTFRKNRVFIVGDAAHLNNPLGGYGMNSGIHDARNLVDKLTAVMRGDADDGLLDRFDRQRRQVTYDFIQDQTKRNMDLMKEGWASAQSEQTEQMRRLHDDREARLDFLRSRAMLTSLKQAEAIA